MTERSLVVEDEHALRNMSAPPRSTLTLHPFQVAPEVASVASQGGETNWGLAWFGRVAFDRILLSLWPEWAEGIGALPPLAEQVGHLRLCGAVALARGLEAPSPHPTSLEPLLGEDLGDELLRRMRDYTHPQALPPLLLATRAEQVERAMEKDPLRALVILTHLSGRTCEPGGGPLLSPALCQGHVLDLWTPEPAHA